MISEQLALHQLHATGVVLLGSSGGGQLMGRTSMLCQEAGIDVLAEIYLSSMFFFVLKKFLYFLNVLHVQASPTGP